MHGEERKGNGLSDLLRVISPVFKQQHESQACFWSPAQNVNCNLSHQPKDVVWKWSLESLHINAGTLWGLCTSYSSNGSSWIRWVFTSSYSQCVIWVCSIAKTKAWHIMMSVYIQEICTWYASKYKKGTVLNVFPTACGFPLLVQPN